jgi:endonuclease/exonuclease/phosphatase family metal-dependent hydrolase
LPVLAALALGAAVLHASPWSRKDLSAMAGDTPAYPGLSVLTYNVEGLPWPVRLGRGGAIDQITGRLRRLRQQGRQPHLIVLQEAFTDAAKRIGLDSGYRYIASGPSRDMEGIQTSDPAAIAFAAASTRLRGENMGKFLDSGLQILSDYPILAVRRAAFPAGACAGFDCLANKGLVMALVAVPGASTPVAIVDTHLNSRWAAHVSFDRSFHAYRRELAAVDRFIREDVPHGLPIILVGDFNVGKDTHRRLAFKTSLQKAALRDALHTCFAANHPCGVLPGDARFSLTRGRDWQIFKSGAETALKVQHIAVPFGHEADGSMLSDHVGYTAYYQLFPSRLI